MTGPEVLAFTFHGDSAETYRAGPALSGRLLAKVAWMPWAALASLVVYSYVEGPQMGTMWPAWAGTLAVAALGFVVPWRLRRQAAAALAQGSPTVQRHEFTRDGIVVSGGGSRLAVSWSAVESAEETEDFFLLHLESRVVLALPQRAIDGAAERLRLRELLAEALGPRARLAARTPRAIG